MIDRPVNDKSVAPVTELSITETQSTPESEKMPIQEPEVVMNTPEIVMNTPEVVMNAPEVVVDKPEVVMDKPEKESNEEPLSVPNTPCAASTPAVQVIHKCDPRPFDSGLGQSGMNSEMSNMDDDPVKQKLFDLSKNDTSYNLRPRKEWFIALKIFTYALIGENWLYHREIRRNWAKFIFDKF